MTDYLGKAEETLKANKGYWTALEIDQQPDMWLETAKVVENHHEALEAWLKPILANKNLRIILTGAGTSAYVGEALYPWLSATLQRPVEAISTTNIVGNPDQYLLKNIPTLLVSFARSGNSPESAAACELADQILDSCYHLTITCNGDSALSKFAAKISNGYCLCLPKPTLDQSFAMTSSYTSMMIATLCVFTPDEEAFSATIDLTKTLLANHHKQAEKQANVDFKRIVFLGSGGLLGIATEARLKVLELSAGRLDCYAESPLGFRHGPKFIIDKNTMVILLNSSDPYRKKYDNDLFNELVKDNQTPHLFKMSEIKILEDSPLDDMWLSFPYIVYAQMIGFYKSCALGLTPDNPCPSGEVNRVVQGVTIHNFKGST